MALSSHSKSKVPSPEVLTVIPPIVEIDSSHVCVQKSSKLWKHNQYLAALAASFGAFAFGSAFGWSATALSYLREDTSRVQVSSLAEEGWIGSIIFLGALASGIPSGLCNERFGRKMTMMMLTLPCLVGWALIFFAHTVPTILIGRFITGLVGGSFALVAPIYIAETSDPDIRGKLSTGFDLGIATGILYIEIVGAYLSLKWQTLACASITVVTHCLLVLVPETPRYLVSKGKTKEAMKALCWLHNASEPVDVKSELDELVRFAAESPKETSKSWKELFKPYILRPYSVVLTIHFFSSITGVTAITAFTVDIFLSSGTHLDEFLCTIIYGITGLVSAIVAALIVDKCGRRPLLIASQFLMGISLSGTGLFYYIKRESIGNINPGLDLDWIPVTSLVVFVAAFACGTGPVSYVIQGEMLPKEAKGVGSSIITLVKWLTAFLATRYFLDVLLILGNQGGYWLFAGFSFIGGIYVILCVPETKGKVLEEIQQRYMN